MQLPLIIPQTRQELENGLLVYNSPKDWGMLFFNVSAIHTKGMKYTIDVVCLDKDGSVLYIAEVSPGVPYFTYPGTEHILEMGLKESQRYNIFLGSRLTVQLAPGFPIANIISP